MASACHSQVYFQEKQQLDLIEGYEDQAGLSSVMLPTCGFWWGITDFISVS